MAGEGFGLREEKERRVSRQDLQDRLDEEEEEKKEILARRRGVQCVSWSVSQWVSVSVCQWVGVSVCQWVGMSVIQCVRVSVVQWMGPRGMGR